MTKGRISRRVIADRLEMLGNLIQQVKALPLDDRDAFFGDQRNVSAAESGLRRHDVLDAPDADLLRVLAGYRNRLVHFYHEVSEEELFSLCSEKLGDLEQLLEAYRTWVQAHPEKLDEAL